LATWLATEDVVKAMELASQFVNIIIQQKNWISGLEFKSNSF